MHELTDLSRYHSILCLNGDLPDIHFFAALDLPVIAADGAANTLIAMDIIPQIIIGDLDSLLPSIRERHNTLHLPDQSSTDFQKALAHLEEQNLLPALVVGINGGYLDHILNNINLLMMTECMIYAPPLIGYVLKEHTKHSLSLPQNSKLSLMGIPSAKVSSQGLKWDLHHDLLSFPGKTSCFNRTEQEQISLEIHEGTVLALIYQDAIHDAGASVKSV